MKPTPKNLARLRHLGYVVDRNIDLAEAALLLASAERPGVSFEPYRRHLKRLTEDVGAYGENAGPPAPRADVLSLRSEALIQVVNRRYGYQGDPDAIEDMESANLMRVIDLRQGRPVALGILYLHIARSLGWAAEALDFPIRFLIRLEHDGVRVILDPFDGGRRVEVQEMRHMIKAASGNQAELLPGHSQALGNRAVLLRLQDHVKSRHLRAGRVTDAIDSLGAMLLVAPHESPLWYESALLHARLDHVEEAVAALEVYLSLGSDEQSRALVLLQDLRARLGP